MDQEFVRSLWFLTRREAQRLIDRRYPGWYIKIVNRKGDAKIYDPTHRARYALRDGNTR